MVDEQKLRELAGAATPGPWKSSGSRLKKDHRNICSHVNAGEQLSIGLDVERGVANAAYMAAANPAAIIALLDELQTMRVTAKNAEKDAARYRWLRSIPDGFKAQNIVNDTPHGMDAAIDAAMKGES